MALTSCVPLQNASVLEIPSLKSLKQVGGVLAVLNTAWLNGNSLTGLQCVGSGASFVNNTKMNSMTGLENWGGINYLNQALVQTLIVSGPSQLAPSGFAPLKTLARCVGNTSPVTSAISVLPGKPSIFCPSPATTWSNLCLYASGACPPTG
jgi:hypothetical protein